MLVGHKSLWESEQIYSSEIGVERAVFNKGAAFSENPLINIPVKGNSPHWKLSFLPHLNHVLSLVLLQDWVKWVIKFLSRDPASSIPHSLQRVDTMTSRQVQRNSQAEWWRAQKFTSWVRSRFLSQSLNIQEWQKWCWETTVCREVSFLRLSNEKELGKYIHSA